MMHGIPGESRILHPVSELLPNLEALLNQLTGTTAGTHDARTLAEAVAGAATDDDLDRALDAVITTWRQP